MKRKFAYPLIISLAAVTMIGGLSACANDNGMSQQGPNYAAAVDINPETGKSTSARSALPNGNPGSANSGDGSHAGRSGGGQH